MNWIIDLYRVQKSDNQTLEVWSVGVSERWSVNHAQHNISHHRIRRHCVNRTRLSWSESYSSRDTSYLITPSTPVLWPRHGLVSKKFVILHRNQMASVFITTCLLTSVSPSIWWDINILCASCHVPASHIHVGWECPDILSLYHSNPDLTFAPCPSWYPSAAKMSTWQIDKPESIFQIESKSKFWAPQRQIDISLHWFLLTGSKGLMQKIIDSRSWAAMWPTGHNSVILLFGQKLYPQWILIV